MPEIKQKFALALILLTSTQQRSGLIQFCKIGGPRSVIPMLQRAYVEMIFSEDSELEWKPMRVDTFQSPLVLPQELMMSKTTDNQFQRLRQNPGIRRIHK